MTNDFITALQWIFHAGYSLLTSFYFPGTNVTPLAMILFGAATGIIFKFLSRLLEFSPSASNSSPRGGHDEKD